MLSTNQEGEFQLHFYFFSWLFPFRDYFVFIDYSIVIISGHRYHGTYLDDLDEYIGTFRIYYIVVCSSLSFSGGRTTVRARFMEVIFGTLFYYYILAAIGTTTFTTSLYAILVLAHLRLRSYWMLLRDLDYAGLVVGVDHCFP